MDIISIILISVGLAMDAFAVAIANGIKQRPCEINFLAKNAIIFGFFQGFLFFLGFAICYFFAEKVPSINHFIANFDHWLALILLSILGLKMIAEDIKTKRGGECQNAQSSSSISTLNLVVLGIAVSIDALVTGIVFVSQPHIILLASILVFIGTLLFSALGVWLGANVGQRIKFRPNILGGIILIGIGVKIFLDHIQ